MEKCLLCAPLKLSARTPRGTVLAFLVCLLFFLSIYWPDHTVSGKYLIAAGRQDTAECPTRSSSPSRYTSQGGLRPQMVVASVDLGDRLAHNRAVRTKLKQQQFNRQELHVERLSAMGGDPTVPPQPRPMTGRASGARRQRREQLWRRPWPSGGKRAAR